MKCIVLAAGYATRLYPLTENFPKPLLKVGEKTILDWLVDDIAFSGCADEYIIVSNSRFARLFEDWAMQKRASAGLSIRVLDDGTDSNETRLGAVRDIALAIDTLALTGDLLVIAGDNVLDFSLARFIAYAQAKKSTCVMRYYEGDVKRLQRSGVAQVDNNDLILSMEEKPENPKSHYCTPPFYYYTEADAQRIGAAIAQGCQTDAPGSFIAWLSARAKVYAMEMPGKRYDIGNLDSYHLAQEHYKGITR